MANLIAASSPVWAAEEPNPDGSEGPTVAAPGAPVATDVTPEVAPDGKPSAASDGKTKAEKQDPVVMRFKAPEPTIDLPSAPEFDIPVSASKRALVLSRLGVSARATLFYDRPGNWTVQVPNFGLGVAVGAGRRTEVNLRFIAPIEGAMLLDAGFLWQGIGAPNFVLGLGARLGVLTLHEEDDTRLAVRPAFEMPIAFRPHNMFRIETGLTLEAFAPTDGKELGYAGFVTRTPSPTIAGPGVPLRGLMNLSEQFFLGVETGFGVLELRSHMTPEEVTDGVFLPLGSRVGVTIPIDGRPLVDLTGQFAFPYFLIGAETHPVTELWQLGLSVETFFGL